MTLANRYFTRTLPIKREMNAIPILTTSRFIVRTKLESRNSNSQNSQSANEFYTNFNRTADIWKIRCCVENAEVDIFA